MRRKNVITTAVLPAGGLGTRFLPATKAIPKEILPVVDKPMIQYAVEEAEKCGVTDFVIITGKNKDSLEDHFDFATELEELLQTKHNDKMLEEIRRTNKKNFAFVRQGKPLGLGHAVSCAQPFVKSQAFLVILSDDIIDPTIPYLRSLIDIYDAYHGSVIALEEVAESDIERYGVICGDKIEGDLYKIRSLVEKPSRHEAPSNLAVIGRYILTCEIFAAIGETSKGVNGEFQLTDALNHLAQNSDVYGVVLRGKRYDVGDKLGFVKATIDFAMKREEFREELRKHIMSLI